MTGPDHVDSSESRRRSAAPSADMPEGVGRRRLPQRWGNGSTQVVRILQGSAPIVIGLIAWGMLAGGRESGSLIPSPIDVFDAFKQWMTAPSAPPTATGVISYSGEWFGAVQASSVRVLAGYGAGAVLGVILGVAAGYYATVRHFIEPFINLLRAVPIIGWLPLSLVIFGFGLQSAIFLIGLGSFFPVFVNSLDGVRSVERSLVRVGQMTGASGFQLMRTVILPAALPSIVAGLRIAMGFAWILVIVAEWEAVHSGLGHVLLQSYSFLRYDFVVAAMISVGATGFFYDAVLRVILAPFVSWKQRMGHSDD